MKKFLLLVILSLFAKAMQAQSISQIETTKSWYHVYDETGKLVKTISTSQGELMW